MVEIKIEWWTSSRLYSISLYLNRTFWRSKIIYGGYFTKSGVLNSSVEQVELLKDTYQNDQVQDLKVSSGYPLVESSDAVEILSTGSGPAAQFTSLWSDMKFLVSSQFPHSEQYFPHSSQVVNQQFSTDEFLVEKKQLDVESTSNWRGLPSDLTEPESAFLLLPAGRKAKSCMIGAHAF